MHVHKHVDLPDGTYTLTQEEEGSASGELNQVSGQQDLEQSPEEPKAVVEFEEGKHRIHIAFFIKKSHFNFTFQYLCFTVCI
jgi:hypothetical protein